MTKRILINATHPEELRVALVDGQWLYDLDIETPGREQKKANIYKGRITRIEPSLEAAFVDYGAERHGFLPFREISREYFASENVNVEELNRSNIKEYLKEGTEILVQIDKEERGSKGAALTTFISLAGSYLVLMPNNPRAGGISRRIEGDDRAELREAFSALTIPEGMGVIIRTAGVGRRVEELQWDLNVLVNQWEAIRQATVHIHAPALIYQEGNAVIRAIRDHLRPEIEEIVLDDPAIYDSIRKHIQIVRPDFIEKVHLYQDSVPLFTRYQIESQIESAFRRSIQLNSGGSIVIDHTEALVSIDINSARATKGGDIEETALLTNLEAADEIARQLRLRDIGGLIVIDFIDMMSVRNQRAVEKRLREAAQMDRAKIQIGRISRFGLLEMSRQRLRPILAESTRMPCPRCHGQGYILTVESHALLVVRQIIDEAARENTESIRVEVPVDVATYLINEKRHVIQGLEQRHQIRIIIIPNAQFMSPQYHLERMRKSIASGYEQQSYKMLSKVDNRAEFGSLSQQRPFVSEKPAVQSVLPTTPAPSHKEEQPGFIKKVFGRFFKSSDEGQGQGQGQGSSGPSEPTFSSPAQSDYARRQPGRQQGQHRGSQGYRGKRQDRHDRQDRQERPDRQEHPHRGERQEYGRGERQDGRGGERKDYGRGSDRSERREQFRGERQDQFRGGRQDQLRGERQDQFQRQEQFRGGRPEQGRIDHQDQTRRQEPFRGEGQEQMRSEPRGYSHREQQRDWSSDQGEQESGEFGGDRTGGSGERTGGGGERTGGSGESSGGSGERTGGSGERSGGSGERSGGFEGADGSERSGGFSGGSTGSGGFSGGSSGSSGFPSGSVGSSSSDRMQGGISGGRQQRSGGGHHKKRRRFRSHHGQGHGQSHPHGHGGQSHIPGQGTQGLGQDDGQHGQSHPQDHGQNLRQTHMMQGQHPETKQAQHSMQGQDRAMHGQDYGSHWQEQRQGQRQESLAHDQTHAEHTSDRASHSQPLAPHSQSYLSHKQENQAQSMQPAQSGQAQQANTTQSADQGSRDTQPSWGETRPGVEPRSRPSVEPEIKPSKESGIGHEPSKDESSSGSTESGTVGGDNVGGRSSGTDKPQAENKNAENKDTVPSGEDRE